MRLEGKGLVFRYRRNGPPVLQGVDLTLESGERLGLSAPSGRGKTTLCRLLAGYESPQGGEVLLDGRPLSDYKGYCPVQLLWQHPEEAADPLMKMGDMLLEGGPVEERILQGLQIRPQWLERYPSELSGGELQRFCVARALGGNPRFLLCDELSAMLDLITQAQLWSFLLEEARRRNLGLLIASHTPPLLDRLCTRRFALD